MVDQGQGRPVVLIPGIQGRWEWMRPTVRCLSQSCRVLTFSLPNRSEAGRGVFDAWTETIDAALATTALTGVTLIGVSFGGLVALRYAARRPGAASALVLVSTPAPTFQPDPTTQEYLQRPRRSLPSFAWRAAGRLWPEVAAARPTPATRAGTFLSSAARAVRYPLSPTRMARWARDWMDTDLTADCARVQVPTLIVTGEPHLDRVVPVASSLQYLKLIPGARHQTLANTGHMGLITKPVEFTRLIRDFIGTVEVTA